jgi:hypothetical protein
MKVNVRYPCRTLYQQCGECQSNLASHLLNHDIAVENQVLQPIQDILDVCMIVFIYYKSKGLKRTYKSTKPIVGISFIKKLGQGGHSKPYSRRLG